MRPGTSNQQMNNMISDSGMTSKTNLRSDTVNELPKVNIFANPIQEPTFDDTPSFIENHDIEDSEPSTSDFDFAIPSFLRKK